MEQKAIIHLAPMQGLTDLAYRNAYLSHFAGVDYAYTPFLMSANQKFRAFEMHELQANRFPEKTIPQIMTNSPKECVWMAKEIQSQGFGHINLNMGCPFPMITKKKRGSGLLTEPQLLEPIFDAFFAESNMKLSLKLRLGVANERDSLKLAQLLNKYPFHYIIIHPRTAKQKYSGTVSLSGFKELKESLSAEIVYNGDIFCHENFINIKTEFPDIQHFMLGRGILRMPFLPEIITQNNLMKKEILLERLYAFHSDIMNAYLQERKKEHAVLQRLKPFWKQLSEAFTHPDAVFRIIRKTTTLDDYCDAVRLVFSISRDAISDNISGSTFTIKAGNA